MGDGSAGIKGGSHVADIAPVRAGSACAVRGGWKRRHVYAIEINPEYVGTSDAGETRELPNIRTVLGKPNDPMLPPASIEVAFLLKTYHEIAQPIAFLRRLRAALRPGARLGIIDKNGKGDDHGLNADVVIKEAAQGGFALVAQHDFVKGDKMDYFLVLKVRGSE